MVRLSVNVNKIATLRNARGGDKPNVLEAARTCVEAGAHGITVHPRPDARHIRYQDVLDLEAALTVELNVEGYPSPEFLDLVCGVRPAQCTLVPDPPDVLTSNAGWDLRGDTTLVTKALARLRGEGIRTSLFLDPDPAQVALAKRVGTDRIELYTMDYAEAFGTPAEDAVFARYREAAAAAGTHGLGVNAGHDLDLKNLPRMVAELPGLLEVSIGHALIADALYRGLAPTVRAYLAAVGAAA
jgi:pyridoxine 5-phosphate synthase